MISSQVSENLKYIGEINNSIIELLKIFKNKGLKFNFKKENNHDNIIAISNISFKVIENKDIEYFKEHIFFDENIYDILKNNENINIIFWEILQKIYKYYLLLKINLTSDETEIKKFKSYIDIIHKNSVISGNFDFQLLMNSVMSGNEELFKKELKNVLNQIKNMSDEQMKSLVTMVGNKLFDSESFGMLKNLLNMANCNMNFN